MSHLNCPPLVSCSHVLYFLCTATICRSGDDRDAGLDGLPARLQAESLQGSQNPRSSKNVIVAFKIIRCVYVSSLITFSLSLFLNRSASFPFTCRHPILYTRYRFGGKRGTSLQYDLQGRPITQVLSTLGITSAV